VTFAGNDNSSVNLGSGKRTGGGTKNDPAEVQCEDAPHNPIIIIMDGKCKVINPQDGYIVATLKKGDVFGDSDFLKYTVRYK
jgi:hypothetical protein